MKKITDRFKLNNGYGMPCIGYGSWKTPDGETAVAAVRSAIEAGYRHIDTAASYKNEASVGQAIKESGVERSELFVTSKLWNTERGYEKAKLAFENTLKELQLDYLDLYLIHWPAAKHQFENWEEINLSTWEALRDLYKEGKVKAIGVSNFLPHHLDALVKTEVVPMVNQIEFHPGQMQRETLEYCRKHQITVSAWSPLGNGKMLSDPALTAIAEKYQKSVAQICIRWCLQNQVIPLPKSLNPSRIKENMQVFDFEISKEDMDVINSMPYMGGSGFHPDRVEF